jgi:hypothetical protein
MSKPAMGKRNGKSNDGKRPENVSGGYSALAHAVLDSTAYTGASITAKALLNELVRQHNGSNNGRLHLVHTWLAGRGWPSKSTVDKARAELLERGLIIQTRQGGLVIGPTWYALSWLEISNFVGLEVVPRTYSKGAWTLCKLPRTSRRKPPLKKRDAQPVHRGSTDPYTGAARPAIDPYTGAIKPIFGPSTDPYTGDDVVNQCPPAFNPFIRKGWKFHGWHEPRAAMVSIFH